MIHFVTALPCEAKPLIERFELKLISSAHFLFPPRAEESEAGRLPFHVYEGDHIRLIVSGVGKLAAASATAYLHAITGSFRNQTWMNIGIGGHKNFPVGEAVLAHKVTDHSSGTNWYPQILGDVPCRTASILTVDKPEAYFVEDSVYDMESAGFFSTAVRFSSLELIHVYKVISDNQFSPFTNISSQSVEQLIAAQLDELEILVQKEMELSAKMAAINSEPGELKIFLERWHFTVSETHQLKRLLKRWNIFRPGETLLTDELTKLGRAKEVLNFISTQINLIPVEF